MIPAAETVPFLALLSFQGFISDQKLGFYWEVACTHSSGMKTERAYDVKLGIVSTIQGKIR